MAKLGVSSIFTKSKGNSKVDNLGLIQDLEEDPYTRITGYARRNSLETIVQEISDGTLSTDQSTSHFGDRLDELMSYSFKGASLVEYNLNNGDTVIYVPREHYPRALPSRIAESTTLDDMVLVRLNGVTCTDDDYIVIPRELVKNEKFASLTSTLMWNEREKIAPGLLVTQIERPLTTIYERLSLFYDEDYAKSGLLIQAIYNENKTLTLKALEPGNRKRNLKEKEVTIRYDAEANNYLVSAERILKAVSDRYSK